MVATNALSAANAYRNQLKLMEATPQVQEDPSSQTSFADLIHNAINEAVGTQAHSEHTQLDSMTGKVELSDLVTAVANAELSLNTVVAVRDRVINAYNDIIKMSI